jgi:predicted esterase YcpF (UPF0227 family)
MRVIYFHGFASSPKTNKVNILRDAGFIVNAPVIDIDPEIANNQLIDFIRLEANVYAGKRVFVGTSLGGYWAARMGELFNSATVLINPAMQPEKSLKKYVGEYINHNTGEKSVLTNKIVDKYADYPSFGSERYRSYFIATKDTKLVKTSNEGQLFEYDSDDHQGYSFFHDIVNHIKLMESLPIQDPSDFPDFVLTQLFPR